MPMSCELSKVFINWFVIFVILRYDVFVFHGFMMFTLILQTPTHGVVHNKNVVEWKDSNHMRGVYLHIEWKVVMNRSDGTLCI